MALSSLVFACDKDKSSTANTPQVSGSSVSGNNSYTGLRTDVVLTPDNAGKFPSSVFSVRDFSLIGSHVFALFPTPGNQNKEITHPDETITCNNSGQVTSASEIDDNTYLGSKKITFENCIIDGVEYDGSTNAVVTAYDTNVNKPIALSVIYNGLKLSAGKKSITLTGTLKATRDLSIKTSMLTFNIHMNDQNGESVLTDIRMDVTENVNYSVSSTLHGKVCRGKQGCSMIQTIKPFSVNYNGVMTEGELVLTGSNNSTANVQVIQYDHMQVSMN